MFNILYGKNFLDDYIKIFFFAPTFSMLLAYLMWYYFNQEKFYNFKINPEYSNSETIKSEIDLGMHSFTYAAANAALFAFLFCRKKTKINFHFEFSFRYIFSTIVKMIVLLILTDSFQAFFHNCCHRIALLNKDHLKHHSYNNPTPFALYANAELELFMLTFGLILFSRTFEMNLFFYLSVHIFNIIYGLYIHSGYHFFDTDWIMTSLHHYSHHDKNYSDINCGHNRGFFFKFSDLLMGTLYKPHFEPHNQIYRTNFSEINCIIRSYLIDKVLNRFNQMCLLIFAKIILSKLICSCDCFNLDLP